MYPRFRRFAGFASCIRSQRSVPGLEAAASYLPAAGGTTVVGDFYDLFHVSPAAVLTQLNRALLDQRAEERFLTAVYATFRTTPAGCAGLDAAGVITRLGEIIARHCGGWASDDTALLALRVPPDPAI
jgi:hypothetical protein